jgi:uncharacterized protein (DUF302 family)
MKPGTGVTLQNLRLVHDRTSIPSAISFVQPGNGRGLVPGRTRSWQSLKSAHRRGSKPQGGARHVPLAYNRVLCRSIQEALMYGFNVTVRGRFDEVVGRVTEELKKEGFGVLTDIDVQSTLKAKLGVERRPYRILGACNPPLAHQAIEADPDIGLLLPCNVVVREEEDGSINVGFMDPAAVLGLVQRKELDQLGEQVRSKLERVRDALRG